MKKPKNLFAVDPTDRFKSSPITNYFRLLGAGLERVLIHQIMRYIAVEEYSIGRRLRHTAHNIPSANVVDAVTIEVTHTPHRCFAKASRYFEVPKHIASRKVAKRGNTPSKNTDHTIPSNRLHEEC